jgi:hypothetical protein
MKALKPWIVLGLVFIAGIAVGVGGTRFFIRRVVEQVATRPAIVANRIERELVRELRLTPEQRPKVHEIVMRRHEDLQQLRKDFQPRLVGILKQSEREIRDVLDEGQREKFDHMLKAKPLLPPALAKPAPTQR